MDYKDVRKEIADQVIFWNQHAKMDENVIIPRDLFFKMAQLSNAYIIHLERDRPWLYGDEK